MGGKHRPSAQSNQFDADSKRVALDAIGQGVGEFTDWAGHWTGSHGCMFDWKSEVIVQMEHAPDCGPTQMATLAPLPFTSEDEADLSRIFTGGLWVVVWFALALARLQTPLLFQFQCPCDYANNIMGGLQQLDAKGIYVIVNTPEAKIVYAQKAFLHRYGLAVNRKYQDMPWQAPKLHKPLSGTRFICSCTTSSMKPITVWADRLLNAFSEESCQKSLA